MHFRLKCDILYIVKEAQRKRFDTDHSTPHYKQVVTSQRTNRKMYLFMEMNIIKITDSNTTGNKKLDNAINKIYTEFNKGIKASHTIARTLEKIKNEELYLAVGSSSLSDFCESRFGISKSQASRLVAISERFLNVTVIDPDGKVEYLYEEYTTSKLVEMLKATDEQLAMITSDMTVKEIRDFISGKAIEDNTDDSDDGDDGDGSGSEKKSNKNKFDVEALKAKINEAIDALSYGEIAEKSAYENVLDWIEELI